MATTLTAVLLYRDLLVLLHEGDSRGYHLRGGKPYQLSKDDTFVQSLIDAERDLGSAKTGR
jgi:protein phosphatase